MLYFAYGSNLNLFQMKRRCKDSVFLKKYELKGYKLNFRSKYRAADIEKVKILCSVYLKFLKVRKLDVYEDFPVLYKKLYFPLLQQKVMLHNG